MPDDQQQPQQQQLNIELDADVADGLFANLVMIAHSPEEFIVDFIRVMPGVPKAKVKSRVIVTPQHAKRMLRALAENIERYERSFGTIEERTPPGQAVQFGTPGAEA